MKSKLTTLVALASFIASCAALAQVRVDEAWVRGTVPGQRTSAAYMSLTSPADTALVSAATPVAGGVELHETTREGDVMRMRAIPRVELKANRKLELQPGGVHLMLISLARELKAGERVPITLTFEDRNGRRTSVDVSASVRTIAGEASKHHH